MKEKVFVVSFFTQMKPIWSYREVLAMHRQNDLIKRINESYSKAFMLLLFYRLIFFAINTRGHKTTPIESWLNDLSLRKN